MARRSLKALQDKINNEGKDSNNSGSLFYPHWKLPFDGTTKVRILEDPNEDNPLAVYVTFMEHRLHIGDDVVRVPCLRNKGKDHNCPICDLAKKFYDAGNEDKGKYYYRDMYAVLRAVVTKDGLEYSDGEETAKGKVKVFKFSYQIFNKLKAEIAKLEDDDLFWDLEEGLDFAIVKDKQMGKGGQEYGKYDLSSGFVRKPSAVPDDWRSEIPEEPLSALLSEIPSYDEADATLQKHLKSLMGESDDGDGDDKTTSEDDLMEKLKRQQSKNKKAEEPVAEEEKEKEKEKDEPVSKDTPDDDSDNPLAGLVDGDDDDDDDDDDILSQLRS
jgi:hypothetical protein